MPTEPEDPQSADYVSIQSTSTDHEIALARLAQRLNFMAEQYDKAKELAEYLQGTDAAKDADHLVDSIWSEMSSIQAQQTVERKLLAQCLRDEERAAK